MLKYMGKEHPSLHIYYVSETQNTQKNENTTKNGIKPPEITPSSARLVKLAAQECPTTNIKGEGVLLTIVAGDPAASTLYLDGTQTIFSINIANDSNDTYIYFESTYRHAWIGIGTGTGMKNSLMFCLYPTKNRSSTHAPSFLICQS